MDVNAIIKQFNESEIRELNIKAGDFEISLSKNEAVAPIIAGGYAAPAAPAAPVAAASTEVAAPAVEAVTPAVDTSDAHAITSPLVGVVYVKPAPDKADFVKVGDTVTKGQVVCIIEAMKVMNELTSDVDGEIVEILVSNEQVVEFGQPLFKVK
ncbi:MAG: acetyl-CoA carboxylase biotin carboxyl carrier protein [Lactobacillales bacterium]|nr:acetyl-CoA carboxylase biotin carboxyl carrier protein [Lactobacillales bacterium]